MKKRTPHLRFVVFRDGSDRWVWNIMQGSRSLTYAIHTFKTKTAARNEARKVMRFAAKAEIEEVME